MSAALGPSAALLTTLGDCHLPPLWSVSAVTCLSPPAPPPPLHPLWQQRHRLPPTPPPPLKPLTAVAASTPATQRLSTASLPLACSNCRLPILQRQYLCLNDGRPWHSECLLCCQCRHPLGMESRCYVREGRVYCKYDYQRLLAVTPVLPKSHKSCKRCSRLLCIDELIIRTPLHVFHCDCFRCIHCSCVLKPGDRYVLINEFPLCLRDLSLRRSINPIQQSDETKILKSVVPNSDSSRQTSELIGFEAEVSVSSPRKLPEMNATEFMPVPLDNAATVRGLQFPVLGDSEVSRRNSPSSHLTPTLRSQHPTPQPPPPPTPSYLANEPRSYFREAFLPKFPPPRRNRKRRGAFPACLSRAYDDAVEGLCLNAMTRQKRIRTSFKHSQLRAMKAFFAINHNPDGKDLKGLSEKTGLSKRVLQVWFQNARAKFRRSVLRPDQNCLASLAATNTKCSDSHHTSTVISEPIPVQAHDSGLNQSGDDNLSCVLSDETRTINSEDPEALERFALNDSFFDARQENFPNGNGGGVDDGDNYSDRQRTQPKLREEDDSSDFFGSSPLPLPIIGQGRYS